MCVATANEVLNNTIRVLKIQKQPNKTKSENTNTYSDH